MPPKHKTNSKLKRSKYATKVEYGLGYRTKLFSLSKKHRTSRALSTRPSRVGLRDETIHSISLFFEEFFFEESLSLASLVSRTKVKTKVSPFGKNCVLIDMILMW